MKTKTSELTGDALDWAVAECEGRDCYADKDGIWFRDSSTHPDGSETDYGGWTLCGPIIEREGMSIGYDVELCEEEGHQYWATVLAVDSGEGRTFGPTPLIAAMRCFVTSRLGEEVEVPDELLGEEDDKTGRDARKLGEAMLRVILERNLGSYDLPKDSIVFNQGE